jgi:hypothetical protein
LNLTNYGKTSGFQAIGTIATTSDNATIMAVNAATGQMVWSHFIASQGYRGGLTTSGNVVYATLSSGDIQMLNAQTSTLIKDYYIGGPLNELAVIGATASGTEEVVTAITAGSVTWGTGVPGDIVALTLQNVPPSGPGSTVTSTSTSTTTATSTTTVGGGAGSTTTTTVTASGAGSTATTTVTKAGSGATTTVTASGAGSTATTTVTSTASGTTTSTGVSSSTLYAVAAIAVIFIIATGYLAMRGRKPAS